MSLRAGRVLFFLAVLAIAAPARAADDYTLGPDSLPQPGVPAGAIHKFSLANSRLFPGTQRDYWVYVPAQYRAAVPACVMVFQDGERFVKVDGNWRVPVVFDNLIHRKQMPVTIGVFVNPGVTPPASPDAQPRFNRSLEYDGLGDGYVRFLLEELLPEVGKRWNLSREPGCRGIGGSSSGAIAAFTAAWHRPDAFQRVFSSIGTYVGLRGGDGYPALVRKSEARPIRVFLQDGSNDNDGYGGSWWYANQAMLAALQFAGYEVQHAWGDGAHNHKHGSSVLPDALRFLWKGFPASPRAAGGAKQPVVEVVDPTGDWQPVGEGYRSVGGLAAGPGGEIYVSDAVAGRIDRIDAQGNRRVFVAASDGAAGLAVGPDGRLYGAQPGRGRIVAWDAQGRPTVIAEGIAASDLVIARDRTVFAAEPRAGRVWSINARGQADRRQRPRLPRRPELHPRPGLAVRVRRAGPLRPIVRRAARRDAGARPAVLPPAPRRRGRRQRRRRPGGGRDRAPVRGHAAGGAVLRSTGAGQRHPPPPRRPLAGPSGVRRPRAGHVVAGGGRSPVPPQEQDPRRDLRRDADQTTDAEAVNARSVWKRAPASRAWTSVSSSACRLWASGRRRSGWRAISAAGIPSASASHRSMPCSSRLKNGWRSADATSRRRSQAGAVISAVPITGTRSPGVTAIGSSRIGRSPRR